MRNAIKFLFIFLCILLTSCSQSYTLTNGFEAGKSHTLNYVDPFCSVITEKTTSEKKDSSSFKAYSNVINVLEQNKKKYHLKEKVHISDTALQRNFYNDVLTLTASIDNENKLRNKTISANIVNVLNLQNEKELAFIIYNRNQIAVNKQKIYEAGLATSIVMLGLIGSTIYSGNAHGATFNKGGYYLLVFNKDLQKITYYKKVVIAKEDFNNPKKLKAKTDMLFRAVQPITHY